MKSNNPFKHLENPFKAINTFFENINGLDYLFLQINPYIGCASVCSYCHIHYLDRNLPKEKILICKDINSLKNQIEQICLDLKGIPSVFQLGQMQDPLLLENFYKIKFGKSLMQILIPLFKKYEGHTFIILSKRINTRFIEKFVPSKNIILAWSLNSDYVIKNYESGTPTLQKRIKTILKMKRKGWRIAVRMDPVIFYPSWKSDYKELIEKINFIFPDFVVGGILRYQDELLNSSNAKLVNQLKKDKVHLEDYTSKKLNSFVSFFRKNLDPRIIKRIFEEKPQLKLMGNSAFTIGPVANLLDSRFRAYLRRTNFKKYESFKNLP